jgi:hypothetical protein
MSEKRRLVGGLQSDLPELYGRQETTGPMRDIGACTIGGPKG